MKTINDIKPGRKYRCRNGLTAVIISVDEPGMRPVRARIDNPGHAVHDRYFTADGHEYADWLKRKNRGESPYDFVEEIH